MDKWNVQAVKQHTWETYIEISLLLENHIFVLLMLFYKEKI